MSSPDYGRLKSSNNQTKFAKENNPAFQTINGLINGLQDVQENADAAIAIVRSSVEQLHNITIIEATGPVTYVLADYVTNAAGLVIFKDIAGTASGANITLEGTVEGTVDPVINTDFGFYHVYLGESDGLLHTW